MDSHLNIPTVDISRVRKYSLADLDTIDFSTSDDLAIVVENLRNIISLELNIENFWNEENEQLLWQFVIDPESLILSCYFSDDKLFVTCDVPRVNVTELFWIIKAFPEKLYSSDYNTKLLFGTVKAPIFESLYSLFSHLYAPVFFKSQDWSKCIQTDYQNSLTEFLSELFHMNNELFGKVIFYVPEQVLHKDIITILDNKELLNQVEKAVMQWIWIFVTVLMKRNSDTAENRGPLEEIEFWELKHSDLKNILSQLDRDDVKLCIEALKSANLASYYKFIELKDNLLVEFNIAVSNIKFLSLLKDTCVLLRESAMTDIPSILPKLLDLTRIIWNNSSYYKDTIMSNLLGKVNNFVITVISCHVPLEEIFLSVHVTDLKNKLINVISCCKSWLEIFDYSEKVHKKFAPSTWSVEPISPLVNLFIHRCEEFIEICNYKEDFHCDAVLERYAQGLKCFEIVEHFQKIELKFQTLLADLSQSTPVALNVNKAEWYDYFKKFKVEISELYVAVSKLMSNKFENLNSIEEGIQILSLFQKFFEKQVVKHELRKCVKYLYELFFKEVNCVKKQLIDLDESSDLLYPTFGGRAFYASILPQRIKQLYKIINDSKSIWPLEYNEEVEEFYEQALGSIEEYKHTLFLQWCKTIPKEPYAWLSDLIIIKKENSEFFYINLNKDVLNTIYELFYWNKARVEIPQSIIHLHQKSDIFLKRIFRMVECVRSYNRIVNSLSSDEKMYFRNVLLSLEEDVKPAIIGLNWSAPQSKAIEALKVFTNRVKLAKEVFENFEISKGKLSNVLKEISRKSLFLEDFEPCIEFSKFVKIQSDFKERSIGEIKSYIVLYCQEISRSLDLMNITEDDISSRTIITNSLDPLLVVLVECYTGYLAEFGFLFGASRKNKLRVIFKSFISLNGKQLSFIPDSTKFKEGLNKMIEDTSCNLSNLLIFQGLFLEDFDYSEQFFLGINSSSAISQLKHDIDKGFLQLHEAEKRYENEWNPFSCLWEMDKCSILKAFQDNNWKASDFENSIDSFNKIAAKIPDVPQYKVLEFCIIDCQPLKDSAIACGEKWKNNLGDILSEISCTNLDNAYHLIELVDAKFQETPKNLEDLKFSIKFLRKSKQYSSEIEKYFNSIREYFDVLVKFEFPINQKSSDQLKNLDDRWKTLNKDFTNYYEKLQKVQAFHLRRFLEYHKELENQIKILENEMNLKGPFHMDCNYEDAMDHISSYIKTLHYLQEREHQMKHDAPFFNIDLKPLDTLEIVEIEIECLKTSWLYVTQYQNFLNDWTDITIMNFNGMEKQKCTDELQADINVLRAEKGFHYKLLDELSLCLNDLNDCYRVVTDFQEPTFQARHWNMLGNILNLDLDDCEKFFKSQKFTFQFLRNFDLSSISYEVNMITLRARKEHEIEQTLNFARKTWENIYFSLNLYGNNYKLDDSGDIVDIVENQLTTLGVLKTSKYVLYFSDQVDDLDNSLRLILDSIELMESFQKRFFPLEVIFSVQVGQAELSKESPQFQEVITLWADVSNVIKSVKLAWQTCHEEGFVDRLYELNRKIEGIQQSLNFYLDSKRRVFPRFYFISNDDLLTIIGLQKSTAIQPYLKKLFDSLHRLEIMEKTEEKMREKIVTNQALGMYSSCNESVQFSNPINLEGPVESWLLEIEKMMHSALKTSLSKCLQALSTALSKEEYDFGTSKWLTKFPGQVCLLAIMIQWTAEVTQGIKTVQETAVTSALKALKKKWRNILYQLSKRLRKPETKPLLQKKIMNLILSIVHSCDVIESLMKYVCNNVAAFEWIVHLRYYMNYDKNTCMIRQTNSTFSYGFEYLGNTDRLVITPNTDRCFLSITTALNLHQGAFLKGCKNSGKTETLKEVGKAFGNYVLIMNCSENMTHFSLMRMLSGLAQIGAWGLFERFNLLKTEIISVLSQEVSSIFNSQARKESYFSFMGNKTPLNNRCGIFLSFDSGSNFSIPFGLSDVFRPASIISPDCKLIIEVYLFSYGFQEAKALAADVDLVFKKMREQLSRKLHYSFGLRAIMHFLKYLKEKKKLDSHLSEDEFIVSSLRETTVQILDSFDIPIFESILEIVFGFFKSDHDSKLELCNDIKKVLEENFLQPDSSTIETIKYLYELRKYYHSIILLGESGSGKTTTWKMLKELEAQYNRTEDSKLSAVHSFIFNAKAFTLKELFGFFPENEIWSDGLFSATLRKACLNERAKESWLILNGPLDKEWIGNISSLLDANKVFTLANGERIVLANMVTLIFETTNILHCSPSILSCMGIVYHKSSNVVWKNFLFSWIHKCENENLIPVVKKLIEEYMENILEFAFDSLRSLKSLSITKLNCVSSFSCLMDIYVKNVSPQKVDSTIISRIFWLSIIWSIGAAISEDEKNEFDAFIKSLNDSLNALESVYNYHLDANFEWIKWSSYLPEKWQPPMNSPFENWFIPTARCISYQHFILQFTNTLHPVLLIGNSRCGKTALVEDLFSVLDRDTYTHNIVNILPQISSNKFQTVIESQLEKKAGGIMLPHFKRKLINFLDNIDNIICDESGSQPPLELLLMAIDCGFWYDRKTWTKNCLRNVSYVASSSSFGSANKIPDPLLNRFCVFNVPELKDEMKNIFLTLMKQKIPSVSLETQRLLNSLSSGTVKAYELIRENFLPTPTKLHYLFHLRSVKKVLFNLLNINTEYLDNRISITKFWFHEFTREFSDLLINDDDRLLMFRVLAGVVEKEFLIPVARVCAENEPVFVKFLTPDTGYNEIQDISILQKLLETYIESYKHKKLKDLQIVLFKQYLDHFVRILRAIENPHGNVILLGASGTGRRTLCKIGAFVLNYEVFEITFDEDFDEQSFKAALQKLLRQIGINGKDVLFIISDYQISDDFYLEFLSDIVAIGVPPDLFSSLELKEIYSEMEKSMIVPKGGNDFFKHFASNIKSHFHLAFCVSYTSSHYKRSILKYPDLYKHSTVDWFEEWPVEALETISEKFLLDLQEPPIDQKVLQTYSVILCDMHLDTLRLAETEKSENNVFETSSSFVKLVNAFKRLLVNKQEKVQYSLNRLISGLQKINETQDKVNEIAKQTKEAHEKLVIATRECDAALIDIKAKREIVEQKQKIIEEKKIEIERKEKVCKKIELAAQEDLNAALPALEEARKALEALNKRDIGEIKSYAKPPELVALVLQAVMILRDSEPSWAEAKRQLGSPNFLKQLMEFDRDNIPDDALDDLEKIIKKKEFKPEKVGKVSFAAKSLCLWVKAMYMYGRIYKKVKPKVERLRLVQEELSKLQKTLSDLFAELNALHEAIAQLEHEHDLLMKTKEEYARKEKELALKLARAESIMESLRSEKERWQLKVATLQEKKDYVIGDSFLASGYLTYLGPYDQYFRSNISTKWKTKISSKFAFNQEFSLAEFFVEEDVLNDWIMCGLPSDQYSFEGAAIVNEDLSWSFLVDPEGHAAKWIKNLSVKNKLKYIDYQDPKYLSLLELAISEGFPVLIENMNPKLNLIINSLLKLSKNQNICFNGKEMKMNPNFRLFMSTKLSNPDFSSFAIKELFIVNFTIKQKGLEDQLLPIIVRNERPDLELIKEKLVKGIIDCKKRFTAVEDKILKLLSKAEGSLLEDEVLVHALQECKSESNEVEMELTSNQKTEVRIDQARDEYRPCAKLASILYFVLADMNKVNLIYMFALDSYLDLFLNSIQKSQKDPEVSGRIKKVNLFHQYSVYRYACRCVLNKHALLFLFHMCTQILLADHKLGIDEYEFFIHGGKESGEKNKLMNPCSHWLSEESWNQIIQLELLPKFLGITVSFDEAPKLWYEWYSSQEPENKLLPGNWRNICSEFEKLLLIRCLRPDRIINCISNLIANNLGRNFLAYPEIDIREIFEESSAKKPLILFTVSSDAHAEQIISNHAHERNTKYRVLSLAERQGNLASQLIVDSIKVGDWAFISNAHLLQPWLPTLEKIVSILQTVKAHPNFRLWLSSSPIDSFPSSILLNSIVLSLDSPKGIQANMLDLYHKYGSNAGSDFTSLELRFKSLLYSLGFFHSILLCRKRFQNLGWNGTYEFSYSDFKVSSDLLQLYLEEYREDPWDALQEMIAEIIYGGHFTNRRDKELMLDYYNQYISDDVSEKYILAPVENYAVPDDGPIQLYLESIRKLPTRDVPEVFGQHKNAEIPCQMYDSERLLKDMEKIRRQKILEVNIKPEVLFIITKIKEEIPDFLNINAAMKLLKRKPEPYTYVLIQEVRQYNSLLKVVSESLQNLKDVIIGKQMMTEAFYSQVLSIQRMEVPSEWMKIYPSLKPLESWIADLRERIKFFANWISAKNLPVKVWLPAFTNPVSFLNAALLTAAKNSDMMIKDLMWEHQVSTLDEKYIFEAPQEGIYIRGLYLEGAGWDRTNSLLTDPEPLKLITSLPVVHFKPVIESSIRGIYNCPCYYTSKRTDEEGNSLELFSIDLKTKKGKGHWRKRGACLLLCDST